MYARALLAMALYTAAASVNAADIQVAPTRLFFAPQERVKDLTISNPGQRPLLVELQAFHWKSDSREPAADVIISPPIMRIASGESAVARVGFRGVAPADCETTYRLWATEIPAETRPGQPVQIRSRMDLPIFRYTASDCEPKLQAVWLPATRQLRIDNLGNAHALVQKLRLRYSGGETEVRMTSLGYVLPGTQRQFKVPAVPGLDESPWLEALADTPGDTLTLIIKPRP